MSGTTGIGDRPDYTGPVPLKLTLPADLDARLAGLGQAISEASPDVLFAYLFGSVAASTMTRQSDVDIAIYVAPQADAHAARLAVARAAARQLSTDAVDVILLNSCPLSVAGRVLRTRKVIAERDPHARHLYESLTLRKFHDFRIREHRILVERGPRG
jgi:predicted nucleotidyltransferase